MVLAGTFGSSDGILSSSITTTIHAYLSRAAEVAPKEHLSTPLMMFDKTLSTEMYAFLSVLNVDDIKPIRRFLIPEGYVLEQIDVHTDGSQLGSTVVVYYESRKVDEVKTVLVRAGLVVQKINSLQ